MKTATIQARIEPKLKADVDKILAKMGITPSQAINMYYASIKHNKGIPFESKVPNKGLIAAMKEVDARKNLTHAKNADEMVAMLSLKKRKKN